uniref:Uncharacterized protein n=1 Tax=Chenopodium quinoa TaxID=63459 RepID=A0A803N2R5_CHEQI
MFEGGSSKGIQEVTVGASAAADDVSTSGVAADVGLTGETNGLKSHVHGTLHSRMSPSSIVQVMESITDNQLKAIKDIGFGSMEYLKVTQLPLQLGLFLVHHFDAHTCSLKIPNSDPFPITEEHVHQVLGLPIGGIEMDKNNFTRNSNVVKQWKKQFQSNSLSIKIGELKEFLKGHKSAGAMFKRNFVVLCVSTLMNGKQNVNINSDILTFLSDVDKIKDLNWSMYILDCLVKGKLFREQLPTRSFPGSLLFLMINLYLKKYELPVKFQSSKGGQQLCCQPVKNWKYLKEGLELFGEKRLMLVLQPWDWK